MKAYIIVIIVVVVLLIVASIVTVVVIIMMSRKRTLNQGSKSVDSANMSKMACAASLVSAQASFNKVSSNSSSSESTGDKSRVYLVDAQACLDIATEAVLVSSNAYNNAVSAMQRANAGSSEIAKIEVANAATQASIALNARTMSTEASIKAQNIADLTTGIKSNTLSSLASYKTKADITIRSLDLLVICIKSLQSQANYLMGVVTSNMSNTGPSASFYSKCQEAHGKVTSIVTDALDRTVNAYTRYQSLKQISSADTANSVSASVSDYLKTGRDQYREGLSEMANLSDNYHLGMAAAGRAHGYVRAPALLDVKSTIVPSSGVGTTYSSDYSLTYVALSGAETHSATVTFSSLGTTSKLASLTVTLATVDATTGTLTLYRKDNSQVMWKSVDSRVQGTNTVFVFTGTQLGPSNVYSS